MTEKQIERLFVQAIKNKGGIAPKFVSPGLDGVPDRLILMPGGRASFAEIKAPGQVLRPLQIHRKKQIEALGFHVYVIDSAEMIGGAADAICSS